VIHLLDINALIAGIWKDHVHHRRVDSWMKGKKVALCPLTELGFLRISSHPKALGASMQEALTLLEGFWRVAQPRFVADDFSGRYAGAKKTDEVTDYYLAELASRHEMRLATIDLGIKHPAAELIP
jgi:predicted nucleic acid-binding protein